MDENLDNNKFLLVFKGNSFSKTYVRKYQRVLAFDLDETIGSFSDLNILWRGLNKLRKTAFENKEIEQNEFNQILDIYPEFMRYGILNILEYLFIKKKRKECDKFYLYTNNLCNPPWVELIINYIDYKLKIKEKLFDKTICAFKINNKVLELNRTTKDKTYGDFIKCTLLPKSTEICFIDNTYYENMLHEKVYFIQPRPYYHYLTMKQIIERFILSKYGVKFMNDTQTNETIRDFLYDWFELSNKSKIMRNEKNPNVDIIVAQKMMYHIKEFFYLTNRKNRSKKIRWKLSKTTRKYRANSVPSDSSDIEEIE